MTKLRTPTITLDQFHCLHDRFYYGLNTPQQQHFRDFVMIDCARSRKTLNNWIGGYSRPSKKEIEAIAKYFKVPVELIFKPKKIKK